MGRTLHGFARRVVPLLLALLYAVGGVWKLVRRGAFAREVGAFGIAPDALVPATAFAVAVAELATAVLLVARPRLGLGAAAALLVAFSAVLGYGLARGFDVDCGCLPDTGLGLPRHLGFALARNAVLLALVGWAGWARRASAGARPRSARGHGVS